MDQILDFGLTALAPRIGCSRATDEGAKRTAIGEALRDESGVPNGKTIKLSRVSAVMAMIDQVDVQRRR